MKETKIISNVLSSARSEKKAKGVVGKPSEKELELLLEDLLTRAEISDIAQRITIVKALMRGKTQREVAQDLGVSIAKVTRGSQLIQYGNGSLIQIIRDAFR